MHLSVFYVTYQSNHQMYTKWKYLCLRITFCNCLFKIKQLGCNLNTFQSLFIEFVKKSSYVTVLQPKMKKVYLWFLGRT